MLQNIKKRVFDLLEIAPNMGIMHPRARRLRGICLVGVTDATFEHRTRQPAWGMRFAYATYGPFLPCAAIPEISPDGLLMSTAQTSGAHRRIS